MQFSHSSYSLFLIHFRKLPYENTETPYEIHSQCIKGEMKLPRGLNNESRDLLQCIFEVDPNIRISIEDLRAKPFYKKIDWKSLKNRSID